MHACQRMLNFNLLSVDVVIRAAYTGHIAIEVRYRIVQSMHVSLTLLILAWCMFRSLQFFQNLLGCEGTKSPNSSFVLAMFVAFQAIGPIYTCMHA
jgi:hypothetical protein